MDGGAIIAVLGLIVAVAAAIVRKAPGPQPLPTIEPRDHRPANVVFAVVMTLLAIALCVAGQFIRVPDLDSAASLL